MVEMVKTLLNGEYELILPKHRADRAEWYTPEGWERERLSALKKEIEHQKELGWQPVVFYIGSEESEMTALCQIWGAQVLLVEPNPKVWPHAKAIWEANNLALPMGCFEGFASNKTSNDAYEHIFCGEWPPSANGEVVSDHGFSELHLEGGSLPQARLSEIVGVGEINYPSIITFDCEGSDWEVLKGLESILRSPVKPTIFASIHPEFMATIYGQHSRDFRNWIIAFGYEETFLSYQHELHMMYQPEEKRTHSIWPR